MTRRELFVSVLLGASTQKLLPAVGSVPIEAKSWVSLHYADKAEVYAPWYMRQAVISSHEVNITFPVVTKDLQKPVYFIGYHDEDSLRMVPVTPVMATCGDTIHVNLT